MALVRVKGQSRFHGLQLCATHFSQSSFVVVLRSRFEGVGVVRDVIGNPEGPITKDEDDRSANQTDNLFKAFPSRPSRIRSASIPC
jgi:hypothetical protein